MILLGSIRRPNLENLLARQLLRGEGGSGNQNGTLEPIREL